MTTGLLRRVVRQLPTPFDFCLAYELECGHKYFESNDVAMLRRWNLMVGHSCVQCVACDQAADIPDTVSACFPEPQGDTY